MNKRRKLIDDIKVIIDAAEKEVSKIYKDSSLEKPIANDVVLTTRNMAYNGIREKIDKFNEMQEDD